MAESPVDTSRRQEKDSDPLGLEGAFVPGDTIVVDGYRAKNGSNMIDARRVTLADGRIVSGASAGDGGPQ